jgi:hypothetical protein
MLVCLPLLAQTTLDQTLVQIPCGGPSEIPLYKNRPLDPGASFERIAWISCGDRVVVVSGDSSVSEVRTEAGVEGWIFNYVLTTTEILLRLSAFATLEKPDFSGEWILNRQTSSVSPLAKPVKSGVVRIEHRDPVFRPKATFESDYGPMQYFPPYEYELRSDGREVSFIMEEDTRVVSLRWEGQALVATWRILHADVRISERYELIDNGRRLRVVEQVRGGVDQDNIWIFERR